MNRWILVAIGLCTLLSCRKNGNESKMEDENATVKAKFSLMSPNVTGVTFSNYSKNYKEDYFYNIFVYEYMYNGGGVATGDVNGDSLPDIYFTSTFGSNKLYINQGNLKFIDVTERAGVAAKIGFKTGTTMADINGDGKLDIYVCRTSKTDDHQKTDHAFINMGNTLENGVAIPTFKDQSRLIGLDDNSNTNHACFFDFDRDGDLDVFLLNHRLDLSTATKLRLRQESDGTIIRITDPSTPFESNRLYRNDHGMFVNVGPKAGLESSAFGLSVTASDINRDGWMDLYIANDYIEPDKIFINNKDGTFTDHFFDYLKYTCHNAMGSDVADINNDGFDDIMVLDMKSEDPVRYKMLANGMQYDRYNLLVQYGYGRQVGRNVLQLNNGNNTFSEIGQYAGVATTDWSWGSLIADFDNDGWKDLYIANGYRRDVTDFDYMNFTRDSLEQTGGLTPRRFPDINVVLKLIPEHKEQNYLFINNKELAFTNATKQAGMDKLSFSNGSAYADLDRDGDLDLIVNNIIDTAFIYRNDVAGDHWLQIDLQGTNGNIDAIGASVDLYAGGMHQHQMMITNKGFFSSSEPILHFGLGSAGIIDSIILQWPEGGSEIQRSVAVDRRLIWKPGMGEPYTGRATTSGELLFTDASQVQGWSHRDDGFVDFKREKLLPYMISAEGPCISAGDVNGDQLVDFYVGNGRGYPPALFLQDKDKSFVESNVPAIRRDSAYESCGSVLEDMDNDGDKDLIVISGGNAFEENSKGYLTRYYVNDGKGSFSRSPDFPSIITNAGAVHAFDFDNDQDLDLIIAGRSTPGAYPLPPRSFLLQNENGSFTDVTHELFPELENLGMITDIESGDLDGDQKREVIIVGDWLPVSVFNFDGKVFKNLTSSYGLEKTSGWWKSINLSDIDADGDMDMIAGNIGLNHRLETSEQYPVTLIANDFDNNGSIDPVLCFYYNEKLYPYAGRDALIGQIPKLKKKFIRYATYASATVYDIFTKDEFKGSTTLTVNTFQTIYFKNEHKKFVSQPLPYQVQLAPVYDVIIDDFNHDGKKDILMAGNFLYSETETGEMDAGNGTLLLQKDDGSFRFVPNTEHGFWAQDEVRELKEISLADGKKAILTANNRGPVQIHTLLK